MKIEYITTIYHSIKHHYLTELSWLTFRTTL